MAVRQQPAVRVDGNKKDKDNDEENSPDARDEKEASMRQQARSIWESASRPLFVRSVWLERIGEKGRSHRRHFILDYEPRERQRWIQCQRQSARRGCINHQIDSCELYDQSTTLDDSCDYTLDEYLLLDATKLTLQRQQQAGQGPGGMANKMQNGFSNFSGRQSSRHAKRRAWLLSSGKSYQLDHLTDYHSHSRRSSLQDAPATSTHIANPEERLAERVLNWLDLAGRADIVKAATPLQVNSNSSILPRSSQRSNRLNQRGMSFKRISTAASAQRVVPRKPATKQPPALPSPALNYRSNSSNAKPITIIFNKEGVPVRLNRPARNIDLCALSNSASTTRRLAGHLASARLYNGQTATPTTTEETRTPPSSSRGLNATQLDSRKQLHIFMPSLPKKGLLLATTTSSEDVLSASFSDLCF
ncbi:uncharacterized protein LOC117785764 [Drosophila innubila]|uniref:uncharacterized protein LOC117785764 n=1 Tax=Drosophila innubila TaxID=198719 RepID=UPI00148C03B5|nr:uncharacterized protein LOC117785764 [Drosophila innubila]